MLAASALHKDLCWPYKHKVLWYLQLEFVLKLRVIIERVILTSFHQIKNRENRTCLELSVLTPNFPTDTKSWKQA
jgi:hypothetical protein